jgi:dipeptidyl-peptidase-4
MLRPVIETFLLAALRAAARARRAARPALAGLALGASAAAAQRPPGAGAPPGASADSSRLTLDRLFSGEFAGRGYGPVQWTADGDAYTRLEPAPGGRGRDLVRYDAASGRREVVVPAARLVAPGDTVPFAVESYAWSPDGRRLLVFANAQRVWRLNTRGDYWVLDAAGGAPRRLGGRDAPPASLMFARFSPDGGRVAYVRANDLYVEDLAGGAVTRLTTDGSRTRINGTFDWVYEEELSLRDGFRWSPDGRRIAYWQLDAAGVRDFLLLNTTDSLYSYAVPVQYPKAGTDNSAARVGVVDAAGGPTRWLAVPGDPRQHYLARMDWAANSDEVVVQQLDRRQHALAVMLGDARTGTVRTVLTERDSTWVDVVNDVRWLDGGRRFTWTSERDGWRRLYAVSRDGRAAAPLTPAFDLHNPAAATGAPYVAAVDSAAGWLYFAASPDAPTQLYLYRARLDGRGRAERVTPAGRPGTHTYDVAPGARWAIHRFSAFGAPPVTELVRLPDHAVVRTLEDNAALRGRLAGVARGAARFVRLPTRDGVPLDAVGDDARRTSTRAGATRCSSTCTASRGARRRSTRGAAATTCGTCC